MIKIQGHLHQLVRRSPCCRRPQAFQPVSKRCINIYAAGGASANFEQFNIWSSEVNLIKNWKFESDSAIGGNSDCTVSEEMIPITGSDIGISSNSNSINSSNYSNNNSNVDNNNNSGGDSGATEKVLRLSGKLEKRMDGKTPLLNMPLYSVFVSALGEFPKTINLEGYVAFRIVMKPTNFSNITLNCRVEPHSKTYMIQAPIVIDLDKEGKEFREYIVPFSFMNFVNEYGHRTDSKYAADDMKLSQIGFLLSDMTPKPSQWTRTYSLDIKSISAINEQDLINCIQPWKFGKKVKPIIVGSPNK